MRTLDHLHRVSPPLLSDEDKELAKAAQRCIMASLDHARAATITLRTDEGGSSPVGELPPATLRLIGQLLGP